MVVAQTIGGSSSTPFFNLQISNTAGDVTLTKNESVSGTLTLSSGILTTSTINIMSVSNAAPAAVSGSSSSFINGPLQWSIGSTGSYLFPLGKTPGNYLPFTLTPAASSLVTAEAFAGEVGSGATFDGSIASISHTEYWHASSGSYSGKVSLTRSTALGGLDIIAESANQGTLILLLAVPLQVLLLLIQIILAAWAIL